ncbi:hypothetical protein GCM10010980_09090 [Corynebacterium marinum]|nr:hypothetical protein GCM10010980_09090 [Corynebacterium marinum]
MQEEGELAEHRDGLFGGVRGGGDPQLHGSAARGAQFDLEAVAVGAVVEKRAGGGREGVLGRRGRQDHPASLDLLDPQMQPGGHPETVQEERRHKDSSTIWG